MTSTSAAAAVDAPAALPLVVNIALAGPQQLPGHLSGTDLMLEAGKAIERVATDLHWTHQQFGCGLLLPAGGGSLVLAQAAVSLGWCLRLLRPHPDDACHDQPPAWQALRQSKQVIEDIVVSTADVAAEREHDASLRLVSEADVLVCLRVSGGAADDPVLRALLQQASARGLPVLELEIALDGGVPRLTPAWLRRDRFELPRLPATLQAIDPPLLLQPGELPAAATYLARVKDHGSRRAGERRSSFTRAASVIVGTHVAATLLAVLALALPESMAGWVPPLLGLEVGLLVWGFMTHRHLHHDRSTMDWALARLCAEICRSVRAFEGNAVALSHVLAMPFPTEIRPLLQTLNVLHLCQARGAKPPDWKQVQSRYVQDRLVGAASAQAAYYARQRASADRLARWAVGLFTGLSLLAIASTAFKLPVKLFHPAWVPGWLLGAAGVLAIVMPVGAVAVMSISAALDAEARAHTFEQMEHFLRRQAARLEAASSPRELAALVAETETRLLGETLNWYSRRAFTSVA